MIFVNGKLLEFSKYPNGETVVPKFDVPNKQKGEVELRLVYEDDGDLLRLALVNGYVQQNHQLPSLVIDYMPYSRMDREQDGHCFSLKYVAEFIRRLGWKSVKVVEPHSKRTLELLHPAEPVWATAKLLPLVMEDMEFNVDVDYLVLPDEGAFKRYDDLCGNLLTKCHVITLEKDRNFETGKIHGLKFRHRRMAGSGYGVPLEGSKALIFDDLSSRGGTFVDAYRILRHGPTRCSSVSLLVTHMEPVGLTGELGTYLDKVYCTDTMHWPAGLVPPDNFHVFDRADWL